MVDFCRPSHKLDLIEPSGAQCTYTIFTIIVERNTKSLHICLHLKSFVDDRLLNDIQGYLLAARLGSNYMP